MVGSSRQTDLRSSVPAYITPRGYYKILPSGTSQKCCAFDALRHPPPHTMLCGCHKTSTQSKKRMPRTWRTANAPPANSSLLLAPCSLLLFRLVLSGGEGRQCLLWRQNTGFSVGGRPAEGSNPGFLAYLPAYACCSAATVHYRQYSSPEFRSSYTIYILHF